MADLASTVIIVICAWLLVTVTGPGWLASTVSTVGLAFIVMVVGALLL